MVYYDSIRLSEVFRWFLMVTSCYLSFLIAFDGNERLSEVFDGF